MGEKQLQSGDVGSTKAFKEMLSRLGKNMKASRFQTWKELRQAQMSVVNVRNQFSWAHEVSAPISFQSLKYFAVLSALRFGRTGSNPKDITHTKKNVHTKSLLMSVMWLKKNTLKGKFADNENVIIYSPPHVIQPCFNHPSVKKKKKVMLVRMSEQFCFIQQQQQQSWFISSSFNINKVIEEHCKYGP